MKTLFEKEKRYIVLLDNAYEIYTSQEVSIPDMCGECNILAPYDRVKDQGEKYLNDVIKVIQELRQSGKDYWYIRLSQSLVGYIFLSDPTIFDEYFCNFVANENENCVDAEFLYSGKYYPIKIEYTADSFGQIYVVPIGGIVI